MEEQVALYRIPETLEVARILDDSVLDSYNESIKSYNSEKARKTLAIFNSSNNKLTGSNPFALVHLANSGLLPKSSRLAERKDLETAVSLDNDFLSNNYVDFGLALRTEKDSYSPNELLSQELAKQLKQREIKLEKGRLISLNSLKLQENENSDYGLVFALNEQASKENIFDLNQFKWGYIRNGLARAFLSWRGWGSDGRFLADSDDSCRVVFVSAEGTAQKFLDEYLAKLQKTRDEEIANIQKRYSQAEALLRGK